MRFSAFLRSVLLCACLSPGLSLAQTILVFGDSLSAAYGIPREAGWVNLLQQELQRTHPQYRVINASISGETTTGGKQRLAAALRQHQPDIVILELGANDGLRGTPITDIKTNLGALIQQSHKAGAKVLLLGMRLPPNYGAAYTAQFQNIFSDLAKKNRVRLFPFLLDGVGPEQFLPDNLHPGKDVQSLLMKNVLMELKPLLR